MPVVWTFPNRILFGEGAIKKVAAEADAVRARRRGDDDGATGSTLALIVTDAGTRAAGIVDVVLDILTEGGVNAEVFEGVSANPLETEVLSAADAYKHAGANLFIGLGGGSANDVAKLARLALTHPLPLSKYDSATGGGSKITGAVPPMLAIPTTAGTGTEVSESGMVTLQSSNRKTTIASPRLVPDTAILDPALNETLPSRLTAATGMDALTHCVEAYLAAGDHPMADAIALQGIQLAALSLENAVSDGKDREARGNMLKAAMMGGVSARKGLGACHSLAHALASAHSLHHGMAKALCLPAVLDFNRSVVPEKIAQIGQLLGARGDDVATLAFEASGALKALSRRIGLPAGLSELDIAEESLPELAQAAFEDAHHETNPREVNADDLLALYRASV